MAYTYENFTNAATNAGLLNSFSDDDLAIAQINPEYGLSLLQLRQDAAKATTAEQKLLAQEAENQLRTSYGSLNKGTQSSFGNTGTQSSFNYGKQTEYQKLLDEVSGYKSFEYDPSSDPAYGSYKKAYLREADRATQDTMAQASAMSGGRPSTYAISAAQQAGNYYRGQLNDAIPTLQQNAYQRYLSDYEAKLSGLDALNTDRNFDYNAYLQDYERQYNAYLQDYERQQQEWNNALAMYQLMGDQTPSQYLDILGITVQPAASGGGEETGSSTNRNPTDPSGLTEAEQDAVTNYVQRMLDNATGSSFNPSRVIAGNSALNDNQKAYAQNVLNEFINAGYMKTSSK